MIELGKKLNGRYQITGNIGSGGMANVFLAQQQNSFIQTLLVFTMLVKKTTCSIW